MESCTNNKYYVMINIHFRFVTFERTFKIKSDGGINPHFIPYYISDRSSMGAFCYPSMPLLFFPVLADLLL